MQLDYSDIAMILIVVVVVYVGFSFFGERGR
jgi:hypothetical protein